MIDMRDKQAYPVNEADMPMPRKRLDVPLYVIRKANQDQYWTCSSEHSTGWNDRFPKQAFTKSEVTKELFRLMEQGWFTDVLIVQLAVAHPESLP